MFGSIQLGSILVHIPLLGRVPWDRILEIVIEQMRRFEHRWRMREHGELVGIILSLLNWVTKIAGIERKMESATANLNR